MAEDGMLLNFELPSDAFAPKSVFKGGNWKDRLTAKKSAEWGRKKSQERATVAKTIPRYREVGSEDEELILPGGPPRKRTKTGEDGPSESRHSESRSSISHAKSSRNVEAVNRPSHYSNSAEFVSSLFTYNPESTVKNLAQQDTTDADIEPSNAPLDKELNTFTDLGLSPILANHLLRKLDIKAPTAIQRKAIQEMCASNTDAFIQAETGSGKTLAYLLPVLQRIMELSKRVRDSGEEFGRESGLLAIILAPTRELSKQISTVLDGLLSCCHWIVSGIVIGGEKKKSEKARLRKGLNILVATPGRLADHFDNTEVLDVSRVRWLVLDEGDRLMELGFEKDIQKIIGVLNLRAKKTQSKSLNGLPDRRTTVLCSATLKTDVDQLRSIALKDPVTISVDETEGFQNEESKVIQQAFSAPAQLKQSYALVPPKQRLVTLVAMLKQSFRRKGSVMRCIVFISCADSVDFHFEVLSQSNALDQPRVDKDDNNDNMKGGQNDRQPTDVAGSRKGEKIVQGRSISEAITQGTSHILSSKDNPGVQIFRLHGSLQQSTRTGTLLAFTKCSQPAVLVCTDVASRGLDLPHVDLVIEYDPPFSRDDHLHRIGRTARAGKDGRAMIFLTPGCEEGYVDILKEGRPHNLTRHVAGELLKKGFSPSSGVVSDRQWEDRATDWQLNAERWVMENPKHLEQARRAFQSHVRAYATHVAAERGIFDMQQLHLGHLAKAFALRDKPSSIRVPGLRPSKHDGERSKNARKIQASRSEAQTGHRGREANVKGSDAVDAAEARKKMRAKMKSLEGASEFNLG
jgi:ATP-dependent RNA helicase DDX31/DBP7